MYEEEEEDEDEETPTVHSLSHLILNERICQESFRSSIGKLIF